MKRAGILVLALGFALACGEAKQTAESAAEKMGDAATSAVEAAGDAAEAAKEGAAAAAASAKDTAAAAAEATEEAASEAAGMAKDMAADAADAAGEMASDAGEAAKEMAGDAADGAMEMASGAADSDGCLDLVGAGKFQEAVPACTAALKLDPDNASLQEALDKAKAALADPAQALSDAQDSAGGLMDKATDAAGEAADN